MSAFDQVIARAAARDRGQLVRLKNMQVARQTLCIDAMDARRWRALESETFDRPWHLLPDHVRRSSQGRPWLGLMVWHQMAPLGDLYIPAATTHTILLRRSTATDLLQRHGNSIEATRWKPGEAVILPAGLPSFWRSSSPRDNVLVNIDPAWLQRAGGADHRLKSCFGRDDPVLAGLSQVLLASLDNNTSLSTSFSENIALAIALHLLENYAEPSADSAAVARLSLRQMNVLRDALADSFHEKWPVARLAHLVGLSPYHFSRAFKASFGTPPHAYVSLKRMEAAARLLRETRKPLAQVAEATGYPSAAHFAHAFRRRWGLTPTAFRSGR